MSNKDEIIKLLESSTLKNIKKNYIINLCNILGVSNEGTKSQLVTNIKNRPDLYCENKQDPISLEDIKDITNSVTFKQNNKYFCFSKESISFMKSQSINKNPFCIDDVDYNDTDKWNMDNIEEFKNIESSDINTSDVPEHIKHRFDIENSTDMYITTYINFLEQLDSNNCKKVLVCIITNIQLHLFYIERNLESVDNFNELLMYLCNTTEDNLVMFKFILSKMSDIEKSLFFLEFDSMLVIQ